jgi:hypothetical protein
MESWLRQEEFEERALRNIKYFINKIFKNVKRMSSRNLTNDMDKVFYRIMNTTQVCEDTLGSRNELMEIIIRSCTRTIYREYRKRYRRNGKASSNLRCWLREAQQNPKLTWEWWQTNSYQHGNLYTRSVSNIILWFSSKMVRWENCKNN